MKRKSTGFCRGLVLTLVAFAVLLVGGTALLNRVDTASSDSELALVQSAVRDAVVTCFAVEGAYPPSVDYLKENYGLAFDDDRYIVVLDAFASNLMPTIQVMEIGAVDA